MNSIKIDVGVVVDLKTYCKLVGIHPRTLDYRLSQLENRLSEGLILVVTPKDFPEVFAPRSTSNKDRVADLKALDKTIHAANVKAQYTLPNVARFKAGFDE